MPTSVPPTTPTRSFIAYTANLNRTPPVYTSEMTQIEQKIIRKAAKGDRAAFRQLVLEHSHAMFRLAWLADSGDEKAIAALVDLLTSQY